MAATVKMRVTLQMLGFVGVHPFSVEHTQSARVWVGPFGVTIPDGTAQQSLIVIGIQGLAVVRSMLITSEQNITVYYNNNVNGHELEAYGFHAFSGTSLQAVSVTNVSGVPAEIVYALSGD